MLSRLLKPAALLLLAFTFACGSKPVHEFHMYGYNEGKKQMKYSVTTWPVKDGESTGYRIETHINYSVGIKERRETLKKVKMTESFLFQSSEANRSVQGQETTTRLERKNKGMVITKIGAEGAEETREVPVEGAIFEIHPLLYTRDLTKPGTEKKYPIFHEASVGVKELTIRFKGSSSLNQGNKKIPCNHYQIEDAQNPGNFSDYYLDPKTKAPLFIKMGAFEFKPARD